MPRVSKKSKIESAKADAPKPVVPETQSPGPVVPATSTLVATAPEPRPLRILAIASNKQGRPFMKFAAQMGHKVMVMTHKTTLKEEGWPKEILEELFAVENWDKKALRNTVSWIAQKRKIDRIVPMGDWDVENACMLREHMRIPGMGETTMRYFRDKLAMRMKTKEDGIIVPDFVHILNHDDVYEFMQRVAPPWVIKPRQEAASMHIKKLADDQAVWKRILELQDKQSEYLLEKYIPGEVFHVDSVVSEREVVFRGISKYGKSMLDLNVDGGVYSTRLIDRKDPDWQVLKDLNDQVIKSLGLVRGVTHIEYIKGPDGFYFLEAGARCGSAKIPDVVWYATDICLWHEWAKIETLDHYQLPAFKEEYAGVVACLARQEWPDLSAYDDPEVVWRQQKKHHAGVIFRSPDPAKVAELEKSYTERFMADFMAHWPTKDHS